jgi:hypothetical protein
MTIPLATGIIKEVVLAETIGKGIGKRLDILALHYIAVLKCCNVIDAMSIH